ncbi:hypothetical protein ACU8KH_03281 [Lachancea thermotolerans]
MCYCGAHFMRQGPRKLTVFGRLLMALVIAINAVLAVSSDNFHPQSRFTIWRAPTYLRCS